MVRVGNVGHCYAGRRHKGRANECDRDGTILGGMRPKKYFKKEETRGSGRSRPAAWHEMCNTKVFVIIGL